MAIEVFLSYSRKDSTFKEQLDISLSLLKRDKKLVTWHDNDIEAGIDFETVIKDKLESAGIILFLLSPDFIASDFCQRELDIALKRHNDQNDSVRVIPIRIRPMDDGWKRTDFGKLNALPSGSKAISEFDNPDQAYAEIATKIRRVVETLQSTGAKSDGSEPDH